MQGTSTYQINVTGILDDTKIRAKLAAIQSEINSGKFGGVATTKGGGTVVGQMGKEAKQTSKNMQGVVKQTNSLGMGLGTVAKKVVAFGAVTSAIQLGTQGIKSMVSNVVDLDASLREFKKVSDLTGKGLEDFTNKAYKAGQATAKTGVEMIDAAT